METVQHKKGDTWRVLGQYLDADGDPVDLDAVPIAISSAVRDEDGVVYALTVTLEPQNLNPGEYIIAGPSADWPLDTELYWDVQFELDGNVFSTPTVRIRLRPDVTPTA